MPLLVERHQSTLPDAMKADLVKVYRDTPEFPSGEAALAALTAALAAADTALYTGVFNGKPICSVLTSGQPEQRQMRYLCVHPANRGRGLAQRLFEEVRRQEAATGARYLEACFDLRQAGVPEMLLRAGFIPQGEPPVYRCLL